MRFVDHLYAQVLLCFLVLAPAYAESTKLTDPTQTRVQKLIKQLGAAGYVQRKHAESELRILGYEAFDQLLEAQYDEFSEISLAAQQLIGRLSVEWTQADAPQITQQIMRNYQRMPRHLRETRAEWLSQLEDGIGIQTVVRMVRYEPSELLAKQAAIYIFENLDRNDASQVEALRIAIEAELGGSQRHPASWLRSFWQDLSAPNAKNLETWQKLAEGEASLEPGLRSSPAIAAALFQVLAEHAIRQDQKGLARLAITKLIELRKEDEDELLETCAWLLDQQQQEIFLELIWNRFEKYKRELPQFLYFGAEAFAQSDEATSKKLAEQAFKLSDPHPVVTDPIMIAFMRFNSASTLESRGQPEWAIREYKRLAATNHDHWRIEMIKEQASIMQSELLHDRGRDEEAADTLAMLLEEDVTVFFPDEKADEESAGLISRMHYFRSEHFRKQGDRKQQIELLRKAVEADPTDADVLIAMHRLPRADEKWKEDTSKHIRKAVSVFERRLQRFRGAGEIENRADIAKNLNQIAWLVGNTEGDQKKAVEQSRKSLELRPHSPGSLDTLGRTYFAVGDIKNAIKYQRRAVMLQPHSQQIMRQLSEFEAAASQGAKP